MHTWTVEGAETATGKDVVISIEAPTEEDARAEANERGILVSSIHRSVSDPPALDYAGPGIPQNVPLPGFREIPIYVNIVTGEKWLGTIATILMAGGWITVSLIAILIIMAMAGTAASGSGVVGITMLVPAISMAICAIFLFAAAALVRFVGSVGLAVRDIARNSFIRP